MESLEPDVADCLDGCTTGCVQNDSRLQARCEGKCSIRYGPRYKVLLIWWALTNLRGGIEGSSNLSQKNDDLGLIHRLIVVKFKHQVRNSIPRLFTVGNYEK
ncbi:hypothetical protein JHK85_006769 [Glycine max]|nr:hypothetical protein JHK85_006769 [Glycine max]